MAGGRGSDDEEKPGKLYRHLHARPRHVQQAGLGAKVARTGDILAAAAVALLTAWPKTPWRRVDLL